jgi:hypothetical protein
MGDGSSGWKGACDLVSFPRRRIKAQHALALRSKANSKGFHLDRIVEVNRVNEQTGSRRRRYD